MADIIPPIVPAEKPAAAIPPKGADGKFVSVRESMGIRTKKPKVEEKPVEAAPKVEKKPKAAIVPASPSPVIDAEKIASAVETGVKRGMAPPTPPVPKDESESLSPEMKRKYLTLQRMAKNNGAMAEKPKQFLESVKKLETYKAEWHRRLRSNNLRQANVKGSKHCRVSRNKERPLCVPKHWH